MVNERGKQVRQLRQKGEQNSGDAFSKQERVGARSRRPSTSNRSSCSHHSPCSCGPPQNLLRGWHSSGSQKSRDRGSHWREPAEGHTHRAGLHHAQPHPRSPHPYTHWPQAHSWLDHAQHRIGRHRTSTQAAQA